MMTGFGLTRLGGQAQAETVLSATEPSSSPVQFTGWTFDDGALDLGDISAGATGLEIDHRSDSARLLGAVQNASSPSVLPPERPALLNQPIPPKPAMVNSIVEDPVFLSSDLHDAIKDVLRPLHRELAESDLGIALSGLRAGIDLKFDHIFGDAETVQDTTDATQNRSASASWNGQNSQYDNSESAPTSGQTERDKILASVMLQKLIDDVKPWLFGLAVAYALGYLVKIVIAYAKYRSTRRHRRGQRHQRHHRTENRQGGH